jgi:transcriptional regulator with GAF, ATPase, and Fis domain
LKAQETTTIAVCAHDGAVLDQLVDAVATAGRWGVIPVVWPDPALARAQHTADMYLVQPGPAGPCDELAAVLRSRPAQKPLIMIGGDPTDRGAPTMWLANLPAPTLLAQIIAQAIGNDSAVAETSRPSIPIAPSWRRKSDMIIGSSPAIQRLLHSLDQLATSQTPIAITGESGVGKELVARALHFCGPRANKPFVAINCAAIPENLFEAELFGYQRGAFTGAVTAHTGAFESAHQGTLLLDEIGEMPLAMQAKLLRVLETGEVQRIGSSERKKVQLRLVTATNRNLERAMKTGSFREDLYYRVMVYPLHVPPLRERPEDIALIVTHHLSAISLRENRPALRLTPAALEKLVSYPWPGNVRELINLLERAALLAENRIIDGQHILWPQADGLSPRAESALLPYRDAKGKFEREYYSQLMRTAAGNVSLAAKLGQTTRKEIYDALKRLGLDTMAYREPSEH